MTYPCHICGAQAVELLAAYSTLPRVSSDCKPMPAGGALGTCNTCNAVIKPITAAFKADIGAIYDAYDVYYQGGGMEQIVFDSGSGKGVRRSELLTGLIATTGALPPRGKAIDIGCGNGTFLRALGQRLPEWNLYGMELDDRHLDTMRTIPGFVSLLLGDLKTLEGRYQLITMIHALEHLLDPLESLVALRRNIADDCLLFIEVPNEQENPFDLLIADHVVHFTPWSLEALLLRAGYEVVTLKTDWVRKEISVLARPARAAVVPCQIRPAAGMAAEHINWLADLFQAAKQASESAVPFGIFGTSIAATWLAGALTDRIMFHVDEDASRQGRTFFGKPIIAPADVPHGAVVFLALAPVVAELISTRLQPFDFSVVHPPLLP